MDKIKLVVDKEQNSGSEQQQERPNEEIDPIVQLSPESFSLIGGGSGILHF